MGREKSTANGCTSRHIQHWFITPPVSQRHTGLLNRVRWSLAFSVSEKLRCGTTLSLWDRAHRSVLGMVSIVKMVMRENIELVFESVSMQEVAIH